MATMFGHVSFQDKSLGASFTSLPASWLFVNGSVIDAGGTQSAWIDANFGNGFAVATEAGILAQISGLPTRLSFAWCGTDANEDTAQGIATPGLWGNAYGVTAQTLLEKESACGRNGHGPTRTSPLMQPTEVAIGLTIDDCFGQQGDGYGLALAWSNQTDRESRRSGVARNLLPRASDRKRAGFARHANTHAFGKQRSG
jgi:hypothetical protein